MRDKTNLQRLNELIKKLDVKEPDIKKERSNSFDKGGSVGTVVKQETQRETPLITKVKVNKKKDKKPLIDTTRLLSNYEF